MVRKLEELNTPLSENLAIAMRKRISELRLESTATLLYLKNPAQYQEDSEKYATDTTFQLPAKSSIRKNIKDLLKRLHRISDLENPILSENVGEDDEEDQPLSRIQQACTETSLQQELEQALKACNELQPKALISDKMDAILKKEMNLYEYGGDRGQYLKFAFNSLLTFVPTSVEAERAFSAAGYLATDIRCRLGDDTLSVLCFLRSHFQNV